MDGMSGFSQAIRQDDGDDETNCQPPVLKLEV